ncbi:hypothetical protein B0T21DRAFT_116973 [Apiosordaria backusii]|uniref:Nephrocystin 3-like N-terminal domain-containing protein n=1 Tax=Apiosordaria backusii TaxID=314023 RepID=A0AA40ELP7_9PEZI|nr:hypothetical protein B0T21DRAFT_116973 [Apiosordaria backusii]
MAEIGVVASVIAVIQLSERVTTICKSYIKHVKDYPKELRAIFVEVASLKIVFESLELLEKSTSDSTDSAILVTLLCADGPVNGCQTALKQLEKLISPSASSSSKSPPQNTSKRQRVQNYLSANFSQQRVEEQFERLRWPMRASRAKELLEEVMRHKTTISLALGGEILRDITEIKCDLKEIRKALDEDTIYKICNWFEQTNPSTLHNSMVSLYEPGTGEWQQSPRCLWLSGIPGAGKTVLASYLIQTLATHCEDPVNKQHTMAYYYCYHGHSQDESIPLLRWIPGQLCRRTENVPDLAQKIFQRGLEPGLVDLLNCLASVLQDEALQVSVPP